MYGEPMDGEPDVTQIAALLADGTRMSFLDEISARGPQSIGSLARAAGVSPSVASQHVAKLALGGLVTVERLGRQRRVSLASAHVADALEALSRIAPRPRVLGLRQVNRAQAFALARTCYDHLAGRLGVTVLDRMLAQGWLTPGETGPLLEVLPEGERHFRLLSAEVAPLRQEKRPLARACLDCTERRPHLAGAVGALLLRIFRANEWLLQGEGRALILTATGHPRATANSRPGLGSIPHGRAIAPADPWPACGVRDRPGRPAARPGRLAPRRTTKPRRSAGRFRVPTAGAPSGLP